MTTIKPDYYLKKHLAEKCQERPGITQHKLTGTISAYKEGKKWVFFTTMFDQT